MHKILFISILIYLFLGVEAKENGQTLIEKHITEFIEKEGEVKIDISQMNIFYVVEKSDTLVTLYYNNNLFVAYNSNNSSNPILAFSFNNGFDSSELGEQAKFFKAFYHNIDDHSGFVMQSKGVESEMHEPLLQSEFGQTNCKDQNGNTINVTNIYTPRNVAVGCVAISMATVFHYNQWPIHGSGEHTYTDSWGSLTGEHSANFENEYYDWENILDLYNRKTTVTSERQALGILAYHSAVALEMDFESGGSTSNINKFPSVFNKYFKHYGEYESNNYDTFFNKIDSMIIKKSVVPLAISGNGYAHSIVCDGWQITDKGNKYYHLNMGWWGTSNGWYQIHKDFDVGGYSSIDGGVFNIVPTPDLTVEANNSMFDISWATPQKMNFDGYELQIKVGRNRWETLADLESDSTFQVENDEESSYAFRVRMKYVDFSEIEAWSNIVIIDNDNTNISDSRNIESTNIYPNPVLNILSIDCQSCNLETEIEIFDMFGKTIYNSKLSTSMIKKIDVSDFKSGGYIVQISNVNGIERKIFIKK